MRLERIKYHNYRNIEDAVLEPDPEVTFIGGMNGQGKTNLLEGIYIFASGRSFRTSHDSELIRYGEQSAGLSLSCENETSGSCLMSVRWDGENHKRFCRKNGAPVTLMSEMIGFFRAVLFCPQHLSIVCDGPGARRSFADVALSQSDKLYLSSLRKYSNILSQRNALLRACREPNAPRSLIDTIEIWSEQLAFEAEIIASKRDCYIKRLGEAAGAFVKDMTGGAEVAGLVYRTPRDKSAYLKLLTENIDAELRAGCTLYGIHKDDIQITLSGKDARTFASRGQQRSIALAMKLAEGELSKEYTGEYPVFLFDDVLSELDERRREYLLSGIGGRQVIMTSCEPAVKLKGKAYKVSGGVPELL